MLKYDVNMLLNIFSVSFTTALNKALNGQAPSYIKDLLKYRSSGRVLRSSNKHLLDEPHG